MPFVSKHLRKRRQEADSNIQFPTEQLLGVHEEDIICPFALMVASSVGVLAGAWSYGVAIG